MLPDEASKIKGGPLAGHYGDSYKVGAMGKKKRLDGVT